MHIPEFVRDVLPFVGERRAQFKSQDGHFVLTPQEIAAEAQRRGISASRIYSIGCLACDASALWPAHPWFAHYANCQHEDSPVYLQIAHVDRNHVLRLSNPPAKIRDQLFEEQLET